MLSTQKTVPSTATQKWHDVADFLRNKEAYATGCAPEVIETHISLVFLSDHFVFKLKKPVQFDFLDFSTVERRRHACEQEVKLNRRLAPDVYLGAIPVTVNESGEMALSGTGKASEWVVKMRRLPQDRMLDVLIEAGQKSEIDTEELARTLVKFYQNASASRPEPSHFRSRLAAHVQDNRKELLRPDYALNESLIKRIHGRQLQFVNFEAQLLEERIANDRIIDGHGDLRPEHICMESTPVIFDCIEFSDELRHLDAVDELGFFAMECERLGVREIGEEILNSYAKATDDPVPPRLLDFYKSYRACVRAKVAMLRGSQLGREEREASRALAQTYLKMADHDFGWTSRPLCVIVRGLSGTGKSTLASALAQTMGMSQLQTDQIRRTSAADLTSAGQYGEGRYLSENRDAVYRKMFDQASAGLTDRISMILDACFLSLDLQQHVKAITQALGVPFLIVDCQCPDDIAVARIMQRAKEPGCLSEVRPEHLALQKHDDEGLLPDVPFLKIDTSSGDTASQVQEIIKKLQILVEASAKAQTSGGRNDKVFWASVRRSSAHLTSDPR